MTGDQIKQQLVALSAEYPDWVLQYLPEATLPWEARRLPFRLPATGGYTWLNAPTAERLADLIGGALQLEHQLANEAAARARLEALQIRAAGSGLRSELEHVLTVTAPPTDDGPGQSDTVTCRPRPEDEWRLWFFDGRGEPIERADNVVDALVAIGGALVRSAPAAGGPHG